MSFPTIPDIYDNIDIDRDQVINLLLASIGFEELGLSHIINSEAEKLQYILGTLEGSKPPAKATLNDLLKVNRAVLLTLRTVSKNQMLLQYKLEDVLYYIQLGIQYNLATVTAYAGEAKVTDSDGAYYNRGGVL